MLRTFKHVIFLLNVFFIISFELLLYCVFIDYVSLIDRITIRLSSINILYVKLFQAVALNNKLIDDNINKNLLKFTDNAPWNYNDINFDELIEVANKYNLVLPYGYELPINSGMISLVFKAYNKTTQKQMVIKMKRKNIDIKLNDAIENLQFCMALMNLIPIIKKYQIVEVINKNIDIIRQQTNFSKEVENMIKAKQNCSKLKYVVIPEVNEIVTQEYSNIILMEFIDGIKINQIKEEDYEGFAKQVIKFGFVTSIIHGFAHGDLHGGNILFIKDENEEKYKHKIGVIDFGIMYEVESQYKTNMFNLFTQIFESTPRETAIKLFNSGIIEPYNIFDQIPDEHREKILQFTCELIEETIQNSKKANQFQLYELMYKLKEYLSTTELSVIGIRPSDNFVQTQLVLAMTHGVTFTLCKDEFVSLADTVLNELFNIKLLI